jgi:hypothetical protein
MWCVCVCVSQRCVEFRTELFSLVHLGVYLVHSPARALFFCMHRSREEWPSRARHRGELLSPAPYPSAALQEQTASLQEHTEWCRSVDRVWLVPLDVYHQ